MATVLRENPTFNTLWAAWLKFEPDIQKDVFGKMIDGLLDLPLAGVVEHLAGLSDKYKKFAWEVWAERADLTGYSLQEIVAAQDTEPYHCTYAIIKEWLKQVDLSKYSLSQVKKTSTMLRSRDDILLLWQRWVAQADLSPIGLGEIVKQSSDLSPDVQAIVIGGYKRLSGNWNRYTQAERAEIARKYHVPITVSTVVKQMVAG